MLRLSATFAFLLLATSLVAQEEKNVTPNRQWIAVVNNEKLKEIAPKDGMIVEAKLFEKVWKAWRKDEKVPEVDFTKEFVVVVLASGPNRPGLGASLKDGNLKITSFQTLIGGPGFGYALATFDRKDIKKVNGKELPTK